MVRDLDDQELDGLLMAAGSRPRDDLADRRAYTRAWDQLDAAMSSIPSGDSSDPGEFEQRRHHLLADRSLVSARRRQVSRLAAATLAVAVLGGGTAAAADFIASRTGEQLGGWEINVAGSGDVIDMGGSDLLQTVTDLTADIPFAPGYEEQHQAAMVQFGTYDPGSITTVSMIRFEVGQAAVCSWADAWVDAANRGDAVSESAAAEALQSSVTWEPLVTYSADVLQPAPADTSGVDDGTLLWWLKPLADSASSEQRQQVLDLVSASRACGPERIPVIDTDPNFTWPGER